MDIQRGGWYRAGVEVLWTFVSDTWVKSVKVGKKRSVAERIRSVAELD